ncbi:hypothetical protein ZIOFF_063918 [Zingiber officinale]|uniref:Uncharacterized protein n=1 Tax=Zingiber officinale TaxID=94328 RepID=A0A8J5KKK9_ZINOF|nr:hypothetical protein ZIOFF_063918 [Zingiber officinale]
MGTPRMTKHCHGTADACVAGSRTQAAASTPTPRRRVGPFLLPHPPDSLPTFSLRLSMHARTHATILLRLRGRLYIPAPFPFPVQAFITSELLLLVA